MSNNSNFKIIVKSKNGDKSVNAKKEKTPTIKPQNIFKGRASSSLANDNMAEMSNDTSPGNGNSLSVPSNSKNIIAN